MIRTILPSLFIVFLFATSSLNSYSAEAEQQLENAWQKLAKGTAVAIMRHALAPGFSDPGHFDVNDCSTQRNLSEEGREQARRMGNLFRIKGISNARVLTSQWCRCKDTARLLDIGTPEVLPALNSFFENRSNAEDQTQTIRKGLPSWLQDERVPTVLVTHQVNISALTQSFTSSGEILIITIENDEVRVLASIPTLD